MGVDNNRDDVILLGPFRLDKRGRSLSRAGTPVALSGRALDVLSVLASARGQVLSKDELLTKVWAGRAIEENNLPVHISALRKALGDGWIVTEPGRGYRLLIPAQVASMDVAGSKPTIAVLPFVNMSADPEQEYFADGIAEDITTALARVRSFLVIARNSAFTYKSRPADVRQIGKELGVRYVLDGSVRRSNGRLRVSVQLIDTEAGSQVWAERYDRDLAEMFALQDTITNAICTAIEPAILDAEQQRAAARPPGNLSAWEAYQRGLWHMARPTARDRILTQEFFERAIGLDPAFAPPYYLLAVLHFARAASALDRTVEETILLSEPLARRAIELDPYDADAHAAATIVAAWQEEWDGALARSDQAVAMNANSVLAHRTRGFVLLNFQRYTEARDDFNICLRLSSRDPQNWLVLHQLAQSHYREGGYMAAVSILESAARLYPSEPSILLTLAATLGQLGRRSEGERTLRRVAALVPNPNKLYNPFPTPFRVAADHQHMLDGLKKVGWVHEAARHNG